MFRRRFELLRFFFLYQPSQRPISPRCLTLFYITNPRYLSYQQHASSTPWCRSRTYSCSQRSKQAYNCRSSTPSGWPPAAAPASLDICVPGPAAASPSGSAAGPAGLGPWSFRTDGIDCSVSLDTLNPRLYLFCFLFAIHHLLVAIVVYCVMLAS